MRLRLSHRTGVLSLRTCAYLFAASLIAGVVGYVAIEGYDLGEAVYMSVITLSTVGFAEVRPLSAAGRAFTSAYVIANLAITALFVSQLTQHLRAGGLLTQLRLRLMQNEIDALSGHVIVCGAGRYGSQVVEQLAGTSEDVVLIERSEQAIARVAEALPELLYVRADATTDEALAAAGVARAKSLIATLGDDSDNAFAVLSARELAPPGLTVIARVYQSASRSKLMRVGADHVIEPEQIGGFYMATLVRKPSAVEFFTSLADGPMADVGFEEVAHATLPAGLQGSSLRQMDLRRLTGVSVVAVRHADGHYEVNPDPDTVMRDGSSFIALGDGGQLARLRDLLAAS